MHEPTYNMTKSIQVVNSKYLINECHGINKNLFISLGFLICHNSYDFSPFPDTYRQK